MLTCRTSPSVRALVDVLRPFRVRFIALNNLFRPCMRTLFDTSARDSPQRTQTLVLRRSTCGRSYLGLL